jgi:small subunit ribosomal protein S20
MAHSRSAKKRIRQNITRRLANKSVLTSLKTQVKKFEAVAAGGDAAKANQAFLRTVSMVDKAAKTGRLHPNTAARKKSRLARLLNKAQKTTA